MSVKYVLCFLILIGFGFVQASFAFMNDYPPYDSKNKTYNPSNMQPVVTCRSNVKYTSKDSMFKIVFENTPTYLFTVQDGSCQLVVKNNRNMPLPLTVFYDDVNADGLKDIIIMYGFFGEGLEQYRDRVDIFLRKREGGFRKISYITMVANVKDFIDLDHDSAFEVIISDVHTEGEVDYLVYSIYEFDGHKLENVNSRFKEFPKVIAMPQQGLGSPGVGLTKEQQAKIVKSIDRSIQYKDIR